MRKRALLAFSLPLAAVGTLAGHAVGYTIAGMSHQDARVHGYLSYTPQFVAICAAALALALLVRASGRLQGRPAAWPFTLVPPLAFLAQEMIERLVAGLPAHAVFEPAVYMGLVAQLPIALVGFLVARALLRAADEAARAFADRDRRLVVPRALLPLPVPVSAPMFARLSLDRLGRAPPR